MPPKEPRPANFWKVILNGSENAGMFREVSLGKSDTEIIGYKSVDAQGIPYERRVPGINKTGNITLVQKVIDKGVEDPSTRCDATITLHDHQGGTIAAFNVKQAWPASIDYGTMNANGNEIAVEKIELAHEGIARMT